MSPNAPVSSSPVLVEEIVETIQNGGLVDLILLLQRTKASELDARDPYSSLTPLLALLDRPRSAAQLLALRLVLLKGACTTLPEAIEEAVRMGDNTMVQVLCGEEGEDQKDAEGLKALLQMNEEDLTLWYQRWQSELSEVEGVEQRSAEQLDDSAKRDNKAPSPPFHPSDNSSTINHPPHHPSLDSASLPTPSISPPPLAPQAPLRAVLLSPLPESTTEFALAIRLAQSKYDVLPDSVELGRTSAGVRNARVTLESCAEAERMVTELSGKVLWTGAEAVSAKLTQPPTPSPLPSPIPTLASAPPPQPAPQSGRIRKRPRSPSPNPLADLLRPPQLVNDPHVLSIYNLPMTSTLRTKPTRRLLAECGLNVSEEIQSIECKNAKALVDEHGQPVLDGNGEAIGLRKYIEVAFYGFDVCEKMAKKLRKVEWEGSKLLVYRGDGRPQQIPKTNSTSSPPPMLSYRDVPPHLTLSGAPTPFAEVDHPARGDPPARYASSNQPQQVEAPNSPRGAFIHPSRQALVDGAGAGPKMESSALERD